MPQPSGIPYNGRMLMRKLRNAKYALNGLAIAWREERSFRIQIYLGLLALIFALLLDISIFEWIAVITISGLVLAAEVLNTALEELCDKFKADPDPHIAKIKDLASAAVFITSIAAFIVGVIIFLPRLLALV